MSRIFVSLFVTPLTIVAVGCTSQPLSPTGLAGASEITASTPKAFTDGSPTRSAAGGRPATSGAVFVTSQGLYYDTFVARDPLPMKGKFQLLALRLVSNRKSIEAIDRERAGMKTQQVLQHLPEPYRFVLLWRYWDTDAVGGEAIGGAARGGTQRRLSRALLKTRFPAPSKR